jgi:hypothetical protein
LSSRESVFYRKELNKKMDGESKNPNRREALISGVGAMGLRAAAGLLTGAAAATASESDRDRCKEESLPVSQLNAVFGVDGKLQPGGVLLFDFGRTDFQATIFDISVDADWGFDTEITFQPLCGRALVKWEMCLKDDEVNPVLHGLLAANLRPIETLANAIHNHFLEISPRVKFLHGTAIGDPVGIARGLYTALRQHSNQPFESSPPEDTGLPNEQITDIIGGTSMISGKVLSVDVERKENFRELGVHVEPASQLESKFNFQKIGTNNAALDAEFVLRNFEVGRVVRKLLNSAVKATAIHNHELFIEPKLYYLHAFATGAPLGLARIVRAALELGNFKFEH